jgi:hypothetical protein
MITMYEVLPFTSNYGEPIQPLFCVFFNESEAYEYANQFRWVEIQTTNL